MTTTSLRTRRAVSALFVIAATVGAANLARAQRSGNVTRTRRGDTVVVTTNGSGLWGAPHDAIEVKRVSGDTKETTFGAVYYLQATPDGGVLVVDTKSLDGLIVRKFDADGKFVRNIGGRGNGPGEYIRTNLSISVHPSGTILIRDSDRSVSRFAPDGRLLNSFSLFHTNGSTNEIIAASDGSMYLRAAFLGGPDPTGAPGVMRPMLHYDTTGHIVDSLPEGPRWVAPSTDLSAPRQSWTTLADGRVLYVRTDKVSFLIADRSGKTPPLIAEGPGAPVPYLKEERDEQQGVRDFSRENCVRPGTTPPPRTTVPETKLPARYGGVDTDGRIRIVLTTTAQKIPPKVAASCGGRGGSKTFNFTFEEPPAFALFQADGTFLGEVRFPLRARVTMFGNTAWAVVPDADDVPVLIKYRLHN